MPLIYTQLLDGEAAPQGYCAATTRDQAGLLFKEVKRIIKRSAFLGKLMDGYRHEIATPASDGVSRSCGSTVSGNFWGMGRTDTEFWCDMCHKIGRSKRTDALTLVLASADGVNSWFAWPQYCCRWSGLSTPWHCILIAAIRLSIMSGIRQKGIEQRYRLSMHKTTADWGMMHPGFENRKISSNPLEREALPAKSFSFSMPRTWRDIVWTILNDHITDEVRSVFCAAPPKHLVSDDLGWLDKIIETTSGEPSDIKALLAARLRKSYTCFRAAHATRTDDLTTFYKRGIRALRPEEVHDKVRLLFLNGQHHGVSEARLEAAISDIGDDTREGRLYFAAQEDSLFTREGSSGHYLIYGSEYLYCIAIRTVGTMTAKKVLSGIGRPTMFICDIPMCQIRDGTLEEFSGMMLEFLFADLVDHLGTEVLSPWSGSALSIRGDVAPENIVGHYHPERIFDPLYNA